MVMAGCLTVLISSSGDTNAVSLSPSSSPQPLLSVRHMGGGVYRTESSSDPSSSSCDNVQNKIREINEKQKLIFDCIETLQVGHRDFFFFLDMTPVDIQW